jgi:hypothetical protein
LLGGPPAGADPIGKSNRHIDGDHFRLFIRIHYGFEGGFDSHLDVIWSGEIAEGGHPASLATVHARNPLRHNQLLKNLCHGWRA